MAERSHWWTERWLRSPLFLSLSRSFSDYLPTYIPASLPTYLPPSLSLSLWLICLSSYLVYLSILFIYPSILFIYHIYLSICLSVCLFVHLSVCLPAWLAGWLSVCLQAWKQSFSARPPQFLNLTTSKTQQACETSSILELDNIQNERILRDFLIFRSWQHQKRNKSARLPHFLKLTTSKTKQFCETSFKNGTLSAELTASCQCVLRFFQSTCLKYCACHEKVMPGHTKCCTCHAKPSQQTWRSDAPKCNHSQEISTRTS